MATSKTKGVRDMLTNEQWHEFKDMVYNAATSRSEFFRRLADPRRDLFAECGYPKTESLTIQDYKQLYDREPIATRVVEVLPMESWKNPPVIFESDDIEEETAFEARWKEIASGLRGVSYYRDTEESYHPIWGYLRRLDELVGIGAFGVLLIGIDDGEELEQPVASINERGETVGGGTEVSAELLYLRPFDQSLVEIIGFETDETNPRYGQPTFYNITLTDPNAALSNTSAQSSVVKKVHWSRVVHVVDNPGTSEVYGTPRQRPVINRLYDLQKLYGGSAEMYWRGAFPGLSIETHPQLGGDVEVDTAGMRDQMENYMNGLQRYLSFMGMSAKTLAPQVVDPTPQIDAHINAICIKLGIPKRIFMGSERGELASSQDTILWNGRVADRQRSYINPYIIIPVIDRLIAMGVLPVPEQYGVAWPEMAVLTEVEKATVGLTRTQTMAQYVSGGVENLMPVMYFLTHIMGLTSDEAEAVVDELMNASPEDAFTLEDPAVALAEAEAKKAKAEASGMGADPAAGDAPADGTEV